MTWVVEEPLYIAIMGIVTIAILAFGWMQTSYRPLLYGTVAAAVMTLLLLIVEQWVETESEQLAAALEQMAADVKRNDLEAVLNDIASTAPETRARARSEFPDYSFSRVDIKRNLEITVDSDRQPPRATATFNVAVDGVFKASRTPFRQRFFVELTLVKEDGRWRVATYSYHSPQYGMKIEKYRPQRP